MNKYDNLWFKYYTIFNKEKDSPVLKFFDVFRTLEKWVSNITPNLIPFGV